MMADYYVVLGLGIDSSKEQLEKAISAFEAKGGNPREAKTMKKTLLSEASKANYDMFLRQNYPSRYAK